MTTETTENGSRIEPVELPQSLRNAAFIGSVAVVCFVATAQVGFNPTDEGFIQAISHRIVRGEIPHVDFVAPRPVFSGVVHLFEVIVPLPAIMLGRGVAAVQIWLYSVAVAWLLIGRHPRRWSMATTGAVIASALVNLGRFPLMPWHTIDGVMFVATGFAAIRLSHAAPPVTANRAAIGGMLLLGCASITKQSFAPALLIGAALVVWQCVATGRGRREWLPALVAGSVPPIAYVAVISAFGGLDDMFSQLTGGRSVFGEWITTGFASDTDSRRWMATMGATIVCLWLVARGDGRGTGRLVPRVAAVGVTVLVWWWAWDSVAAAGSRGPMIVWWMAVATVLARLRPTFDLDALLVVAIGWMASLSWGYATPALLAGSLALLVTLRVWEATPSTRGLRVPGALVVTAAVVALLVGTVEVRRDQPYRDRPVEALIGRPAGLPDDLTGVRTNADTWRYLRQVTDCLARYPAGHVAVLPDNPAFEVLFDLDQPFPMVWSTSGELIPGTLERMVSAARDLNASGDYLVLFQTFPASSLATIEVPETVDQGTAPFMHGDGWAEAVRGALGGTRIQCGSFVGNYEPATG